jgi:hypothetical protein
MGLLHAKGSSKYKIPCQSISICAQYVTLDNKIKYLSLADFFFGNLSNVTGTAYMWGLLVEKKPGYTNEKYGSAFRSNLLHSFLEVRNCVAPFTSPSNLHEFGAEKPFFLDVFAINFTVSRHILCSGGDALSGTPINLKWYQQTQSDGHGYTDRNLSDGHGSRDRNLPDGHGGTDRNFIGWSWWYRQKLIGWSW